MHHIKKILLILLFFSHQLLPAQKSYELKLIPVADTSQIYDIKHQSKFKDLKSLNDELNRILRDLIGNGYIAASFDSIHYDSLQANAYLCRGLKYTLAYLEPGNVEPFILDASGFKDKLFRNSPFSLEEISNLNERLLKYSENHGYPFAFVKLDSIRIKNDTIFAALRLEKNNFIVIDSIRIKGSSKIKPVYLYNYLEIKPGQVYNESRIMKIRQKIKNISFVQEIKPFEIGFTKDKAVIILYLDKKKASQFDGIIGIAPNDQNTGKLLITGDVKLKLINMLNRGELLDFNWRKTQPLSQDLRLNFVFPFLFSTPFGIDYKFWLLKQDTSYLTLNNKIGVQYHLNSDNYIKVYYDAINSSLLSTSGMDNITTLPPYADIVSSNYGLEYYMSALDYRFNPTRGFHILASGSFGNKKIEKNPNINPELYDSLELNNNIYKAGLDISFYLPMFKRMTLLLSTRNAFIENEDLFENELYRIGGLKTLRGFDEESIYASLYSILNIELRYVFEQNSYFSIFWNGAYYEKHTVNEDFSDLPWGFGAGLSFQTGAGIFSVYYAMGKQFDNPIELKSAKIHFGYTSLF